MKTKKETRGDKSALEKLEKAHQHGETLPMGSIPIPRQLKIELRGQSASEIMRVAAPFCAHYLFNCILAKKFKPSWARIDVAKYIIDQVEGKAKIRAELTGASGAPLSWAALVILATQAEELEKLGQNPGIGLPLLPLEASKSQTEEKAGDTDPLGVEEATEGGF